MIRKLYSQYYLVHRGRPIFNFSIPSYTNILNGNRFVALSQPYECIVGVIMDITTASNTGIVTRFVFNALSFGSGLVAADLLCVKWDKTISASFSFCFCKLQTQTNLLFSIDVISPL